MAGRLPKEIPYKQYRKIGTLLQDFREYILKPPENRFELLIRCAGQLFLFTEALMSDAAQVAELLDVLRLLRESSGPGVVAAEKTAMERLIWLASECARFLAEEKGKRATSATEAAPDVAQDVGGAVFRHCAQQFHRARLGQSSDQLRRIVQFRLIEKFNSLLKRRLR